MVGEDTERELKQKREEKKRRKERSRRTRKYACFTYFVNISTIMPCSRIDSAPTLALGELLNRLAFLLIIKSIPIKLYNIKIMKRNVYIPRHYSLVA